MEFKGAVCGQYLDRKKVFVPTRSNLGGREKALSDIIHGLLGLMGQPSLLEAAGYWNVQSTQIGENEVGQCTYRSITQALCLYAFPLCEQVISPTGQNGQASQKANEQKAKPLPLCKIDCELISENLCSEEINSLRADFPGMLNRKLYSN